MRCTTPHAHRPPPYSAGNNRRRSPTAPNFNIFNFQQLFEPVLFEMQVMDFGREVMFFRMEVVHFKMQVTHFTKAILAFVRESRAFCLRIRTKIPIIRGRPLRPAPLQMQIYEIFRPKARNVKMAAAQPCAKASARRAGTPHRSFAPRQDQKEGADGPRERKKVYFCSGSSRTLSVRRCFYVRTHRCRT